MTPPQPHRKQVKHYDEPGHVHELTFSCYRRLPLLTNDDWRGRFARAIDRAMERQRFQLAAFVFMPEHVHLLVWPQSPTSRISRMLSNIKQPYSAEIKRLLVAERSPLLKKLTVRERPGKQCFRYWQEGGGYDRNLWEGKALDAVIDYIHLNPVRRGLVKRPEDWRWSSARFYLDRTRPLEPALPKLHMLPASMWE